MTDKRKFLWTLAALALVLCVVALRAIGGDAGAGLGVVLFLAASFALFAGAEA